MLKLVGWILALAVAVVMVVFAITNAAPAPVNLWPVQGYAMPLYLIVFAGIFIGLAVGGLLTWLGGGAWRRRARQAERDIKMLKFELAEHDKKRAAATEKARAEAAKGQALVPAGGGEVIASGS